jgi:hypothetical protein
MARPRKTGDRYKSGDLKPDPLPPTTIRRLLELAQREAKLEFLGSVTGRLYLDKMVAAEHVSAAKRYAEFVGTYDRLVGNRKRSLKSPDYGNGVAIKGEDGDARCATCDCGGNLVRCDRRIKAKIEYNRLEVLLGRDGPVVVQATIYDSAPVGYEAKLALIGALGRLAVYYGYLRHAA